MSFNIFKWIQKSNDKDFIDTIDMYKKKNISLQQQVDSCLVREHGKDLDIAASNKLFYEKDKEINSLRSELKKMKGLTLEEYKGWFEKNIKKYPVKYNFRGKLDYAHNHYENFTNNIELQLKYNESLKIFYDSNKDIKNADELIYQLNLFIDRYLKRSKSEYESDFNNFGKIDYWVSPSQAYEYYMKGNKNFDCDDIGTLKYCCFVSALIVYGFKSDIWRLKSMNVSVLTGGRHYVLAWLKEQNNEVKGWIPVETTYYTNTFVQVWDENLCLKKNILYKLNWSFDEEAEYRKLN